MDPMVVFRQGKEGERKDFLCVFTCCFAASEDFFLSILLGKKEIEGEAKKNHYPLPAPPLSRGQAAKSFN